MYMGAVIAQILTNFTQVKALSSPSFMLQMWPIAYLFLMETAWNSRYIFLCYNLPLHPLLTPYASNN